MSQPASSVPSLDGSIQRKAESDLEQPALEEKHTETTQTGSETLDPWHPSQFPDGGKDAWLCLLGTFCCLFCSFGWLNCIGVFQSYYQTHQLRDYSSSTIAWIASCEIFVMFLPGPIVGFVFDNHGPKHLLLFGTFFHVFGLMMTSLCEQYYQFILAQGICSALGLNCIFTAATSSVTTWFLKKRGAAFGIMAAGSGLGGIIFPIMTNHLTGQIGYGWTMRVSAFMILGLLIIAMITVKSRLPPKKRPFQPIVFIEPFKDIRFVSTTVAGFFFFMGLFIPIDFVEVQALAGGMSPDLASYLIPILNAASIFGRIVPGAMADKLGRFNLQILMSYFAGILVLALWLPGSGNAVYITFAALYGFASGAFVALSPAQIAYISKVEQIGVRTGMLFSCISFAGLASNPIAGQIVVDDNGGFGGLKIFCGVMLLTGATLYIFARATVAGFKWVKV